MPLSRLAPRVAFAVSFVLGMSGCEPLPPQGPCYCPPPSSSAASSGEHTTGAASLPANDGTRQVAAQPRSNEQRPLANQFDGAPALKVYRGQATYYGDSLAGNKTASGEVYDPRQFTAAHRTLPFGTLVRVTRVGTDQARVVYVRITDRGPFGHRRRIIDLSRAAAEELEMIRAGVVEVRVEVVAYPAKR